jgi:hypothetical protein
MLMEGVIDYAGLFPPAGLGMDAAIRKYAEHLASLDRWALGRFVLPASRLGELERACSELPSNHAWRVSALVRAAVDDDLAKVVDFNRRRDDDAPSNGLLVDSIEMRVSTIAEIQRADTTVPRDLSLFFEVPLSDATPSLIETIAGVERHAKIRVGGVTPELFPEPAALATFLVTSADNGVPFKATAGLHHPVRSTQPLTYEPNAPRVTMHGFVNLLLASALVWAGRADVAMAAAVLQEDSPRAFAFGEEGAGWRDQRLDLEQLGLVRLFVRSFGSCSFDEPLDGARALGFL